MSEPITWTNEKRRLSDLIPWKRNPRQIKRDQAKRLQQSLAEFGQVEPVCIGPGNELYNGHQRLKSWAAEFGDIEIDVRVSSRALSEKEREKLTVILHAGAVGNWDWDGIANGFEFSDLQDWGFDADLLKDWKANVGALDNLLKSEEETPPDDPGAQVDKAEELREKWGTALGQLWQIGEHRLICGDCTDAATIRRLLGEDQIDIICTDPPYCSGGFQEAGKARGSVGTSAQHKAIVNDTLSTRGYTALLKSSFSLLDALYLYVFTDWRMWVYLFDIAESSSFGVRSMIVWDKGSPGMGRGWRAQHELVLFGCKQTPPFDKHSSGVGNVIRVDRTGNINHTTEKPVELIEKLLANTPFAQIVADPFSGSGTTLVACERLGRKCRAVELDPKYVAVTLERLSQMGLEPVLISDGSQ